MKRALLNSGQKIMLATVAALLIFGSYQPLIAHAQTAAASAPAASPATDSTSYGGVTNSDIGCNFGSAFSNFGGTIGLCLTNIVYVFTVGIGSGFAYVAAYFFDFALNLSLNSLAYSLNFISSGWTTARDLANMAFLFILIYIALKIMFEAETGQTVHMLAAIIVVALLVNFSFFFTRVVIDAGNILSLQFYNAITAPSIAQSASNAGVQGITSSAVSGLNNAAIGTNFSNSKDLTASIMGMLQLQNLFSTQSFQQFFNPKNGNAKAGFLVTFIALSFLYIAAGIMFWILTVMFATAGVKFLFRIVALWFVIIASPLALIARAVQGPNGMFKSWRNILIQNSFYPVIFMFVFLMLTNFANQMAGNCGTSTGSCNGLINGIFDGLANAPANSSSAVASIGFAAANVGIRLGFVIAMLYVGLMAAQKLGTLGSEAADKFGRWTGQRYLGVFGGLTGGALRQTIGYGGRSIATSSKVREYASKTGLTGFAGRAAFRAGNALGRQSFDTRGGLNALGVAKDVTGEPGGKGGYNAAFDARVKHQEEFAKELKPSASQLEDAYKAELEKMPKEQRGTLEAAAKAAEEAREDNEKYGSEETKNTLKRANQNFNKLAKPVIEAAKKSAGSNNDKTYANTITTRRLATLGRVLASDKEAAVKIRGAKNDSERFKNILEKMKAKDNKGNQRKNPNPSAGNDNNPTPPNQPTPPRTPPPGGTPAPVPPAPTRPTNATAGRPANDNAEGQETNLLLRKLLRTFEKNQTINQRIAKSLNRMTNAPQAEGAIQAALRQQRSAGESKAANDNMRPNSSANDNVPPAAGGTSQAA